MKAHGPSANNAGGNLGAAGMDQARATIERLSNDRSEKYGPTATISRWGMHEIAWYD